MQVQSERRMLLLLSLLACFILGVIFNFIKNGQFILEQVYMRDLHYY